MSGMHYPDNLRYSYNFCFSVKVKMYLLTFPCTMPRISEKHDMQT